jgi:hypothetical protein
MPNEQEQLALGRFFAWAVENIQGVSDTDVGARSFSYHDRAEGRKFRVRFPENAWSQEVEYMRTGVNAQGGPSSEEQHFGLIAMWLDESLGTDAVLPSTIKLDDSYFVPDTFASD